MRLILKPRGRGNWNTVEMTFTKHPDLFAVRVGMLISIGHWVFRVCEVTP